MKLKDATTFLLISIFPHESSKIWFGFYIVEAFFLSFWTFLTKNSSAQKREMTRVRRLQEWTRVKGGRGVMNTNLPPVCPCVRPRRPVHGTHSWSSPAAGGLCPVRWSPAVKMAGGSEHCWTNQSGHEPSIIAASVWISAGAELLQHRIHLCYLDLARRFLMRSARRERSSNSSGLGSSSESDSM